MTEEYDKLKSRIEHLEQEVALLKSQQAEFIKGQQEKPTAQPMPRQEVKIPKPSQPMQHKPTAVKVEQSIVERPAKAKKDFNLEKLLSSLLPKVFMFILLLGVLWGLKVAIDLGYITNVVRVVGGYAGAGVLFYFGLKIYREKNKVFALTLLGGFIALGILTTFAAHHLYGYFNFVTAFIIGLLFIGGGLFLSKKTKSEILTLFSAIAGFLLPFLLEGESVTVYGFCAYILMLFISLFYLSLTERHKYTFYFSFLLFHLTLFVYMLLIGGFSGNIEVPIVLTVIIQHFILLFIYFTKKISRHAFTEALIYTNLVFTLAWIKLLNDSQETFVYGVFAAFYLALSIYTFVKNEQVFRGVFSAVAVFAVTAYILSLHFDDPNVYLLLLLINGAIGIWVGLRYRTLRTIVTGSIVYFFTAMASITFTIIPSFFSLEHVVWLGLLATMGLIYHSIYRFPPTAFKKELKGVDASLIAGQVVTFIYIVQLVDLWLEKTAYIYHTLAHIYMLVYIVVLFGMYWLHKWKRGIYVAHAAVIGFLLLGLWVMTAGLSGYGDDNFIFNSSVEILYVVLLTLLFVAVMKNRFYIQSDNLKKNLSFLALGLQIVFFIFLNKWYLAGAIFYDMEMEYLLLVHTFILFLFAFSSISIGGRYSWKPVKYFGATLIVLCIVKLFLIDLISISILIRAVLFTIVGIVGLLYSKTLFKEK